MPCMTNAAQKGDASPNLSHCYSYLEGVVDTSELYRLMVGAPRCVPDHVTAGQIKDIVLNSLRHHPEKTAARRLLS